MLTLLMHGCFTLYIIQGSLCMNIEYCYLSAAYASEWHAPSQEAWSISSAPRTAITGEYQSCDIQNGRTCTSRFLHVGGYNTPP